MLKRLIDISLAIVIILLCSSFICIILFIVFLIMRKNPLMLQTRKITLDKNEIKMLKIRTIKSSGKLIEFENKSSDIFIKDELEQFVPVFCRWLRKTGIDEIPQVINVLKGEMSLIGPRPFPVHDLNILKVFTPEFYYRRSKINSKPGITGYWQVYGNRLLGTINLIECDEIYEKRKSFLFDFKIILRTCIILIRAKHSDAIIQTKSRSKVYQISREISA